jgi:isopentenyldiphosphate isomerase
VQPNPLEVSAYRYLSMDDLLAEVKQYPLQFTEWFKIALPQLLVYLAQPKV